MIAGLGLWFALQSGVIAVGPGAQHRSIGEALEAAGPWDTVLVDAGVYREQPVISRPVVLLARGHVVIDGGGQGVVLTVLAPARIAGFEIRGSGANQSQEHAGILATGADSLLVENNALRDVLFGVYVKQSAAPVIRNNDIVGKDIPVPLRGDGIRLWYSNGGEIVGNRVRHSRDVVIWFSNNTTVLDNRVEDSRYGLHYMYSDHNRFEGNEFVRNHVGAFLMYSTDITFRDNVFADAHGTTGRGLGFKDTDSVVAEGNVFVRNAVGLSVDNSPTSENVINRFLGNVVAFNDVGVSLLPSVKANAFLANTFLDNAQPVRVTGGGTALANRWRGNFWSEYAGFDADNDGYGDTPFVQERLSDDLMAKHEDLRIFDLGLAAVSLNMLSRVLPLLQPTPVVIDSAPLLARPDLEFRAGASDARPLPAALGLFAAAVAATLVTGHLGRSLRRSG